jgi:hypothetical protein
MTPLLAESRRVLRVDGRLIIADRGCPHDHLMRLAFLRVQLLDGFANTRQHAAGELPRLIRQAGFSVETIDRLRTVWGELELLATTRTRSSPEEDQCPAESRK